MMELAHFRILCNFDIFCFSLSFISRAPLMCFWTIAESESSRVCSSFLFLHKLWAEGILRHILLTRRCTAEVADWLEFNCNYSLRFLLHRRLVFPFFALFLFSFWFSLASGSSRRNEWDSIVACVRVRDFLWLIEAIKFDCLAIGIAKRNCAKNEISNFLLTSLQTFFFV